MKFLILGGILFGLLMALLYITKNGNGRAEEAEEEERIRRAEEEEHRQVSGKRAKYYRNRIRGPEYEDSADRDTGLGCMVLIVQILVEGIFAWIAESLAFSFGGGLLIIIGAEIIGISFILQRCIRRAIVRQYDRKKIRK